MEVLGLVFNDTTSSIESRDTMKLQTLQMNEWNQFAPFVDTCILPVASFQMEQKQLPMHTYVRMESIAHRVEQSLQGRTFLLPTIVDYGFLKDEILSLICQTIATFETSGFTYVVVLLDDKHAYISERELCTSPHLFVNSISISSESESDSDNIEEHVSKITQEIVQLWQNSF